MSGGRKGFFANIYDNLKEEFNRDKEMKVRFQVVIAVHISRYVATVVCGMR